MRMRDSGAVWSVQCKARTSLCQSLARSAALSAKGCCLPCSLAAVLNLGERWIGDAQLPVSLRLAVAASPPPRSRGRPTLAWQAAPPKSSDAE